MKTERPTRRQRQQQSQAEAHPVAWALRQIAREHGSVETTPSQWLQIINDQADDHARRLSAWPATPNQLGASFRELARGLELLGIFMSFRRSNGRRLWKLETVEHADARRHFHATRPQREELRIAREAQDKALLKAVKASLKPPRAAQ
jgi:hypothetical protein